MDKAFLTGGKIKGCYAACGQAGDTVLVCEGVATRDSLYEATGYATVAAFSAGNLLPVAQALRRKFPQAKLVICADNDQWKPDRDNPGVKFATEAAAAVGGVLAVPMFDDNSQQPTDFNDLFRQEGAEVVRAVVMAALGSPVVEPVVAAETLSRDRGVASIEAENQAKKEWEAKIDGSGDFVEMTVTFFTAIENSGLREPTKAALAKRIAAKNKVSVASLKAGFERDEPPPRERETGGWLDEMNQAHAVVAQSGRVRIMNIEHDPIWNRKVVTFSSVQDFKLLYGNRFTYSGNERVSWSDAWIEHPKRKQYRGIAFMPGHDLGEGVYNLWQGFGVEPELKGSCDKFIAYLKEVICMNCEETYHYVWGWLAHLFQRPWELPGTALVMRSIEEGSGKSFLVEVLKVLVGQEHSIEITHMAHLTGQFSAHRAGVLLVFANEATWGGDKAAGGPLKSMITDADTMLEEKHANAIKVKNFSRLIVASQNPFPIARGEKDRRVIVLDVLPTHVKDAEYFAAIETEMLDGGYETLMYLLMNADIKNWHPREVPFTLMVRGWDMKIYSSDSAVKWYLRCLEEGFVASDGPDYSRTWQRSITTKTVQDAYEAHCRRRGEFMESDTKLGIDLKRWGVKRLRESPAPRRWFYEFPPLETLSTMPTPVIGARELFCESFGIPYSHLIGEKEADNDNPS